MATKIRLARGGSKQRPYYRIVVADARSPRDGRFLEKVGTYNPLLDHGHKDRIVINEERIKYWLSVGAQPTDRVARFLGAAKLMDMPAITEQPKKSAPKQKAMERAAALEEAKKAAAAAKAEAEASVAEGSAATEDLVETPAESAADKA